MARVVVYLLEGTGRAKTICDAMFAGIKLVGDAVEVVPEISYNRVRYDVAVFYGYKSKLPQVMADYRAAGRQAVYVDLGYWGRRVGGKRAGYHKIAINARHPTAYFQQRKHIDDRARALNVAALPWQDNGRRGHIIVAGMSKKSSIAEDVPFQSWETKAIRDIARFTDRRIVYRPKPSCKFSKPIAGAEFSTDEQTFEQALVGAHAVVTHHSNVAVEAIAAGVPAFCWHGVAKPMSLQDLSKIEDPWRPDGREQWISDICYTQFTVEEMTRGVPWRHLKEEGLIP